MATFARSQGGYIRRGILYFKNSVLEVVLLHCICFRGTDNFKIELSKDKIKWVTVLEDNLQDARLFGNCAIPMEVFYLSSLTEGRYVRFTVVSFYEDAGGLQYIDWE